MPPPRREPSSLPRRRLLLRLALLLVLASVPLSRCARGGDDAGLFVLVALDGASWDVIDALRAEGRLPHLDGLVRRGVAGPLQSLAARKITSDSPRHGFHSPIVWASVATGKVPEKHGIRDFVLPVEGTSWVPMGSADGRAELRLPELRGRALLLELRLRSEPRLGPQDVRVALNGSEVATLRVPPTWKRFAVPIDGALLRPVRNELAFVFSRTASTDEGPSSAALGGIVVRARTGRTLFELDPMLGRERLGHGFGRPRARLTEVQSVHWRAKPVWSLLGERGIRVGVVGYWGTWPAYEVNGFLVSSRMGIAEQRRASDRLTWPDALRDRLEPLVPAGDEARALFARLGLDRCRPPLLKTYTVLGKIVLQDELYDRIAVELLPELEGGGLFAVYFRSIDVAAHAALGWKEGASPPPGCPEDVRGIVDAIYEKTDERIGSILEHAPPSTTVLVVSDHGMRRVGAVGGHAPNGIFVASGPDLRRGARLAGASVLDVAPTLLYLMGEPVPLDMDGKVLVQALDPDRLGRTPPRYEERDTSLAPTGSAREEGSEAILDELRSLGYIQ